VRSDAADCLGQELLSIGSEALSLQNARRSAASIHRPRASRDQAASKLLFEEKVRVGVVVEAADLGPATAAVELARFGQRTVGIEPKHLDGELPRRAFG